MLKAIYGIFHRHYHRHYHGNYHSAKKLFVFDMALLALALAMLGGSLFFYFWKPSLTDLIDLSISLGNNRTLSGDPVKVTVDYANRTKFKLEKATLSVHLPPGFTVNRALTPTAYFSDKSTIDLGTLLPGAKGQAEVNGWLWVEPKQYERVSALLAYYPETKKNPEQKFSSIYVNLPDSVLNAELWLVADTSFAGQMLPASFKITNTGETTINNINLTSNLPFEALSRKDSKNFSLKPQEVKVIAGEIKTPTKAGDFAWEVRSDITVNNHPVNQTVSQKKFSVFSPQISAAVKFNAPMTYAEAGETVPITVSWKNDSDYKIANLKIRLQTTPGTVDLKSTARENNLQLAGAELIATKLNRTALAGANPGEEGEFNLNLRLLPIFSLRETENASLEITPIIATGVAEVGGQNFESAGNTAKLPLATELKLRAETRYYTADGDQVGRGPLPPAVGETTKYWIFAQITNTTNGVSDAKFSATLLPGAEFTGKQSVSIGPQLQFNADTRTFSWEYHALPANSQTGLYFEVAVTPGPTQIGQAIPLVKDIRFSATDERVGKNFSLLVDLLDNILPADDAGHAKGYQVSAQ